MRESVAALAIIVLFCFFLLTAVQLHPVGEPDAMSMDEYFLSHAQHEIGINNVVTAVVFDYRGFDTLGEATVLFTAVIGVFMVLWEGLK